MRERSKFLYRVPRTMARRFAEGTLQGQVAVLTGASAGLGRATAHPVRQDWPDNLFSR